MRYFPIFLDLLNQPVLVVGGGEVAERKIRLLLKAGAQVNIAAQALNAGTAKLASHASVAWTAKEYDPALLQGARLAYAATDNKVLNRRVHADAERLGIPVNVVDDINHCRFITPAIVDRSPLQIAISSSGTAPVLARRIRGWLERLLPAGIGNVVEAAGRLRPRISTRLPLQQRRHFWDRLFSRQRLLHWSELTTTEIESRILQALDTNGSGSREGKVYLVGAGPGHPDLLTVRALQLLGQADVILFDQLVPEEILDLARRDADRVDVGKRSGTCAQTQDRINNTMLQLARSGEQVIRLKGGDPFIFGRGGEEMAYLEAHGIECEVVPGITAATGCGASAHIPLTHRDHAQVLSLVTGHTAAHADYLDWRGLAGKGRTVAVYMGVKQAEHIRQQLLDSGIAAELPVALVANGTREDQQVLKGDVGSLPKLARRMQPGSAGLLVIGEVARFAAQASELDAIIPSGIPLGIPLRDVA